MRAAPTPPDLCPRCGAGFSCGMGREAPCGCTGFELGAERLAKLAATYTGCLCPDCLAELSRHDPPAVPASPGSVA